MDKKMDAINSIVGEGSVLRGEITTPGSLHVAGEVQGTIKAEKDVFVAHKGKVIGDVEGSRVVVSGTIEGNITARTGLEILKTGKVFGEINCHRLMIEEGSSYQGRVNVAQETQTANV